MVNATTTTPAPAMSRHERFILRATAKSDEQARAGNLPRLVRADVERRVWAVGSRTEGGTYWLLAEQADGQVFCDCPALGPCWHQLHLSRALSGEVGVLAPQRRSA